MHTFPGMVFVTCGDCGEVLRMLPEECSYRTWWVWHPHECKRRDIQ